MEKTQGLGANADLQHFLTAAHQRIRRVARIERTCCCGGIVVTLLILALTSRWSQPANHVNLADGAPQYPHVSMTTEACR